MYAGETVGTGAIILRQCGSRFLAGLNVGVGRDWTLFALKPGVVSFAGRKVNVTPANN